MPRRRSDRSRSGDRKRRRRGRKAEGRKAAGSSSSSSSRDRCRRRAPPSPRASPPRPALLPPPGPPKQGGGASRRRPERLRCLGCLERAPPGGGGACAKCAGALDEMLTDTGGVDALFVAHIGGRCGGYRPTTEVKAALRGLCCALLPLSGDLPVCTVEQDIDPMAVPPPAPVPVCERRDAPPRPAPPALRVRVTSDGGEVLSSDFGPAIGSLEAEGCPVLRCLRNAQAVVAARAEAGRSRARAVQRAAAAGAESRRAARAAAIDVDAESSASVASTSSPSGWSEEWRAGRRAQRRDAAARSRLRRGAQCAAAAVTSFT
eukprot:TRINITY_DN7020_c2_g1_i1.p1 TRINITY_DN7020_c2_g1~~TRINITY_DN7020_c2_g1_i1.p1  ORF type:complete len:319 (+),score=83.54 TRINITY_DN7020_c2_g1_i1:78-1034(+)